MSKQKRRQKKPAETHSASLLTKAPEAEVATTTPAVAPATLPVAPFTEEQKNKMKEINKEFKAAKANIESDTTLSPEQKQSQIKAASKSKSSKMKEIFTPEQLEQMKQNHKKKSEE